ncbi:hypothetical protein DXU92_06945 [Brachybacterium saurashtrense]|uniref:Uncharacterized protein n=1 Tax=Brachybacterium saurashtrense TaxID=556288 RepID=A0A345YKM8_9MICO|nr:hypothetical protein DWV08_01815 [Brachybacterium saurashtrense]RRR23092.1 hypothetical protein DXU92_06945 [Brachybacterium saurashtrense]
MPTTTGRSAGAGRPLGAGSSAGAGRPAPGSRSTGAERLAGAAVMLRSCTAAAWGASSARRRSASRSCGPERLSAWVLPIGPRHRPADDDVPRTRTGPGHVGLARRSAGREGSGELSA